MIRPLLMVVILGIVGCGPQPQPTKLEPYQHSLKATASEDRIKAIEERQNRYGVKLKKEN